MLGERREIGGVMIHVVPLAGLTGAPVTASVMGDDAIAVIQEEHHLRVPIVGAQWPAVTEDDGLAFAPILVVNLCAVVYGNRAHRSDPFLSLELIATLIE